MTTSREITWEPKVGLIGIGIAVVSGIAELIFKNPELGLGVIAGAVINEIAAISIFRKTKKNS